MFATLFGIAYAMVIQQGDVYRQHIRQEPIVMYAGDSEALLYINRYSSRFVVGGIEWTPTNQYGV
jgi:hypothetical protein